MICFGKITPLRGSKAWPSCERQIRRCGGSGSDSGSVRVSGSAATRTPMTSTSDAELELTRSPTFERGERERGRERERELSRRNSRYALWGAPRSWASAEAPFSLPFMAARQRLGNVRGYTLGISYTVKFEPEHTEEIHEHEHAIA